MIRMSLKTMYVIGALSVVCSGGIEANAAKPNIIFILSDDLSYRDLSFYGQKQYATPRLDALAQGGMRFSTAYSGSSECAPARGSLMTGMHMGHCRIRANASSRGQEYLVDSDITVAEVLKQAGYATGFIGKWGIGFPGTEGAPERQGFDLAYGYYDQVRAHGFYPNFMIRNGQREPLPENYGFDMARLYQNNYKPSSDETYANLYDPNGKIQPAGIQNPEKATYSEDLFEEEALHFIRTNQEAPFFLYYATQLPHGPCITPDISEFKDRPWDQRHKEWAAMVQHLDRSVGAMVDLLEELDLLEDTVIFFAGDNGYSQWGYFKRRPFVDDPVFKNKGPWPKGKFTCTHEGGLRVPFFVYWKGHVASGDSSEPCALYDFLPTAAEIADVPAPVSDGKSLVPAMLEQPLKNPPTRHFYWEGGTKSKQAQSARLGDWWATRNSPDEALQLFDLSSDLPCLNNRAADHPEVVEEVLGVFEQEHRDSQWYRNPGEDEPAWEEKKKRAKETGIILTPVKANTTFGRLSEAGESTR